MFLIKPLTTIRTIGAVLIFAIIAGILTGDARPHEPESPPPIGD